MKQTDLYSSDQLKKKIAALLSTQGQVETALKTDTALYNNDDQTIALREKKQLLADEIHIPDKTIASNIAQIQARLISYLRNGESLVTFSLPNNQEHSDTFATRAATFTQGIRVRGWEEPWYKVAHNGLLFGRGFIMVVHDPKQPLKVAFEHVHTSDMLLPENTVRLQDVEMLAVRYRLTQVTFLEYAKRFRWDGAMVSSLHDKHKNETVNAPYAVYRVFYKAPNDKGGMTVYDCWYSEYENGNFLREAAPYMTGLIDIESADPATNKFVARPANSYPFAMYVRKWDSNDNAMKVRGQAELDAPVQSALTMYNGAMVNGSHRASRLLLSPDTEKGQDPIHLENFELKHGILSTAPVKQIKFDYPSAQLGSFMQQIRGQNMQANGATDYAAMTREDSEKRVKELAFAKQTADLLSEASVAPWAAMVHEAMAMAWIIVQSQAILGQAQLYEAADTIKLPVIVAPFGEFDTLSRARFRQRLIEFWAVVKGMPGELPFYEVMLREFFPLQAREWFTVQGHINQLQQSIGQRDQLLLELFNVISTYAQQQPALGQFASQFGSALSALGIQPNNQPSATGPAGPQTATGA